MTRSRRVDGRPAFQFYPDDWLSEAELKMSSLAAQGLWIDLLCRMFKSPQRGTLKTANGEQISNKQLAKLLGEDEQTINKLLLELETNGVFSRLDDETIYNRRMLSIFEHEAEIREARSRAGKASAATKRQQTVNKRANKKSTKSTAPSPSPSPSPTSKSVCVEPCSPLPAFPLKLDGRTWTLTQAKLDELQETFPNKPVLAICRKAWQWCKDNPAKRKTEQGMPAFLSKWISNEYVEVLDEQPDMVSVNWLLEQIDTRAMEHDAAIKAIQNPKNLKRAIDRKTAMKLYCDAKGIEIEARG